MQKLLYYVSSSSLSLSLSSYTVCTVCMYILVTEYDDMYYDNIMCIVHTNLFSYDVEVYMTALTRVIRGNSGGWQPRGHVLK
jgi:hypothetical protein